MSPFFTVMALIETEVPLPETAIGAVYSVDNVVGVDVSSV